MKVGIIGSGDVGKALRRGFVAHGHEAMLGSRDPGQEKVTGWVAATGEHAAAGTLDQTADFGDLAVLATGWSGPKARSGSPDPSGSQARR